MVAFDASDFAAQISLKTTAEKIDVVPARYIVCQVQVETCACPKCRQHIVTAPTPDEVSYPRHGCHRATKRGASSFAPKV